MSTTQDSAFKTNLNAFIEAKGWKPVNLTAALSDLGFDVTDWTVKRWCNGESEPRSSDMYAGIARALGTTPNVLLGFDAGEDAGEDVGDAFNRSHDVTVAGANHKTLSAPRNSAELTRAALGPEGAAAIPTAAAPPSKQGVAL